MAETIGFIGLGDLGSPIAANLIAAGYPLRVHNRTASKANALVAQGAERADRAVDAASPGGIIVSLLWDDTSVEKMVVRDGFLERLGPEGVHVSMTTVSPEGSRRLAALHAEHGVQFVEAPVFGRPEAAVAHKLWIAFAGANAAKDRVRPLFEAMGAQGVFDFGEAIGAAITVKLAGNFLLMSAAGSMREALTMVEKSGFDPKAVIDMLSQTVFPGPIYQTYGRMIAAGPTVPDQSAIPLKDLGLFKQTAEQAGASTAIADLLIALRKPAA